MIYELYVNLNERGLIHVDLRDADMKTVWEISGDWDEVADYDGSGRFDPTDIRTVERHLKEFGVIPVESTVIRGN
jgi:pyruvate/2-oxoglutarate dehydrogenase complex dihydrolipoamide acyltransferase (E2) component